ncbi:MAG TPA: hypothetical protein VFR36_05970 [Sphingomicrobium sp.]|nr:hypothetical protein [Sphingomicrobium sp.]
MARLSLVALSAALVVSSATAAAAAVLVVRSSGPSASSYPPGKALPDNHVLKLKASDTVILLDSRGTRTLQGPGDFSVSADAAPSAAARTAGTSTRRVRLGAVRGTGTRSVWQADLGQSGNVCVANPADLGLWRADSSGETSVTLTEAASGKKAEVKFAAGQSIAPWPTALPATSNTRVDVTGLGTPTTLTLKVLSPIPTGLEGMAQSLIRADCEAQLDVLIDTFSARSAG